MSTFAQTPKDLGNTVRLSLMHEAPFQPQPVQARIKASRAALDKLEQLAIEGATKEPLETRVARLEASVLPPAESCAEAVERFRDALELLAKRHAVEVEVGSIDPGSCCAGITDLDADVEAERERVAWDKIEAWQARAPRKAFRQFESRKFGHLSTRRLCLPSFSLILSERDERTGDDHVFVTQHQSKAFRLPTRLAALEAAASWCEGQK
jgi:hypothetical protein